jgi:hypothetical protein
MIPAEDRTVDRAVCLKWLGYSLVRQGNKEEGRKLLRMTERIFRDLRIREEAFLDLERLRQELGIGKKSDLARLVHFPGIPPGLAKILPTPGEARFGSAQAALRVDLASNEYFDGERWRHSLSLELRLLGWLRIAGDWGVHKLRVVSLLWLDEVFSLFQLEARLDQLMVRLRKKHGFDAKVVDGTLYLEPESFSGLCVYVGGEERPRFLREHREFRTTDIVSFYGLSRSQAHSYLLNWLERGWIQRSADGYRRAS